jgi:hypothetical protein
MVSPTPQMVRVRAVSRAVLKSEWIASGCFPEHFVENSGSILKTNDEPRLTRRGVVEESNTLRALETRGKLHFNRQWVWLP